MVQPSLKMICSALILSLLYRSLGSSQRSLKGSFSLSQMPLALRGCCSIQALTGHWGVLAGVPVQAAGAAHGGVKSCRALITGLRRDACRELQMQTLLLSATNLSAPIHHQLTSETTWTTISGLQWTGHLWLPIAHHWQPCLSEQTSRGWTPDVWVAPWRNLNATMSLSVDKKWYCWLIASKVLTNSSLVLKIQTW